MAQRTLAKDGEGSQRAGTTFGEFSDETAHRMIRWASLPVVPLAIVGFGLGFAPGWANGWGGLNKHAVWAAGMTALATTLFMLAGIVAAIVIIGYAQLALGRDRIGWRWFAALLAMWLLVGLVLAPAIYSGLRSGIAEEWP